MPKAYDPTDWYWTVPDNPDFVWSSKAAAWVQNNDSAYLVWQEAGLVATHISDVASLAEVIISQWVPTKLAGGITLHSTANPSLDGVYATDPTSLNYIIGLSAGVAAGKPLPGGGTTFAYPVGSSHSFSAPDFLNFAAGVENFIYELNGAVISQITQQNPVAIPSTTLQIP